MKNQQTWTDTTGTFAPKANQPPSTTRSSFAHGTEGEGHGGSVRFIQCHADPKIGLEGGGVLGLYRLITGNCKFPSRADIFPKIVLIKSPSLQTSKAAKCRRSLFKIVYFPAPSKMKLIWMLEF